MTRFSHRAVPLALMAVLVDSMGFGIVMPVLPRLITTLGHMELPAATRISGLMLTAFAVCQFFAGPVIGQLGDRFGRRPVLILAMAAFAADYMLMALAPTIAWLFVGRAIAGIAGAVQGPVGAVIADVTDRSERSAAFGLLGAAFGVGFILGPAVGGLVAEMGSRAPFFVAGGLAALNALAMFFLLPETHAADNRRPFHLRDAHVFGSFRPIFAAGDAAPLLLAWICWQLAGMVYPSTWAFWATMRLGWDGRAIGWSLAFVGAMTVLVQMLLTRRVVKRLGERRAGLVGLLCAGATMLAYAFATQGWQVYAYFTVGAVGALCYPAFNGMLSKMVDPSRQGALQGGVASLNSLAAVAGPFIATQALAAGAGRGFDGGAFLVSGALMMVAALVIAFAVKERA